MKETTPHAGWVIVLTFFVAILLTIMSLPEWAQPIRPHWVAMVLVYWCMALPSRVGILSGWICGLLLDVLTGTLLGAQALALSMVAYVTLMLYKQVRVKPLFQQALTLFLILLLTHHIPLLWVQGISGQSIQNWTYWISPFISALLWPMVFLLLRYVRHKFRVT